jgi:DtxR family Mn-dependent transcriptional regulator
VETWKRFGEQEVSHSMAHYLQAVAELKAELGHARVGDIAERLGVSKSGVTSMMRSLQARGLVSHARYGCVELTESGGRLAERTETSRRILATFLREILRIEERIALEDACMIEHLVSPKVSLELLRLTHFLRSSHPAAKACLEAFHAADPGTCVGHAPGTCEWCGARCMGESLASGIVEMVNER